MSKRPPTQLEEQPTTKCINIDQLDEYETANTAINSVVQPLSHSQMFPDLILAIALSMILLNAPTAACLRLEMTLSLSRELIMANPDLKEALDHAIKQQWYEDVMSLCRYL